jgi:DnaJ-class molecular chaperone
MPIKNIAPKTIEGMQLCPVCQGTGVDRSVDILPPTRCKTCGGIGWVKKKPSSVPPVSPN